MTVSIPCPPVPARKTLAVSCAERSRRSAAATASPDEVGVTTCTYWSSGGDVLFSRALREGARGVAPPGACQAAYRLLGCTMRPCPEPAEEPWRAAVVRRCRRRGGAPPYSGRRAHEKLEQQQRVLDEDKGPQPVGVRRRGVPREAVAGEDGDRRVGHEGEERDRTEHLPREGEM